MAIEGTIIYPCYRPRYRVAKRDDTACPQGMGSPTMGDARRVLAIIVIITTTIAGGLWAGQMTNPTSGINGAGVFAGLFLGIALVCTAWIASTRPSSSS